MAKSKADLTVADLRRFHKIGTEANSVDGSYGKAVNERFAKKYGVSASKVQHARTFATMVDEDELSEICELRDYRGRAFGPGTATKLLPVKTRAKRRKILRLWAHNGWTARQLEAAVREGREKTSLGGRKHLNPATADEVLRQIDGMSQWVRWYEQLADDDESALEEIPDAVRKRLKSAIQAIRRLQNEL